MSDEPQRYRYVPVEFPLFDPDWSREATLTFCLLKAREYLGEALHNANHLGDSHAASEIRVVIASLEHVRETPRTRANGTIDVLGIAK